MEMPSLRSQIEKGAYPKPTHELKGYKGLFYSFGEANLILKLDKRRKQLASALKRVKAEIMAVGEDELMDKAS
jgi:hypothetical protein